MSDSLRDALIAGWILAFMGTFLYFAPILFQF
jgi:hypothetical protein